MPITEDDVIDDVIDVGARLRVSVTRTLGHTSRLSTISNRIRQVAPTNNRYRFR